MGNLIVNTACGSSSTIDTIFGHWFMRRRFLNDFAIYDPRDFILTKITLPQGCSMPIINAFLPVVHEKIFFNLSTFSLFYPLLGPKRGQPLYLNKSESPSRKHVSYQA